MSYVYFSRPGRAYSSRYKILAEKETLLSGNLKSYTHSVPSFMIKEEEPKPLAPTALEKLLKEELEELKMQELKNKESLPKIKISPTSSFKSPPRKSEFLKNNTSSAQEYYDINYSQVEKSVAVPSFKSTNKRNLIEKESDLSNFSYREPEWNPKGVIPFSKQTQRKPFINSGSPSDERFVSANLSPEICSKFKRNKVPNLSKYSSRDNILYKTQDCVPEYFPNKEIVMPKIARNVDFDKMLKRKEPVQKERLPSAYNVNFSIVEKNVPIINMKKLLPREKNSESQLPAFLQGSFSSRQLETMCNSKKQINLYELYLKRRKNRQTSNFSPTDFSLDYETFEY
ncbi:unnamed protein product [Blepharisma stoltei]|uniref:Exophilin 5 n=1 Tax=Blepharisma stoltei TaxID=1481888 RepID=A0AAU9JPQ7_9CILI|nr:unnamed protein product [Blepharisma stoltei]